MTPFMFFAALAKYALHARQNPSSAACAAQWVLHHRECVLRKALSIQESWSGPHMYEATHTEYWHCQETGISSWTNPAAQIIFLATVADQLLQSSAFPVSEYKESLEQVTARIHAERRKHCSGHVEKKLKPRPATVAAGARSSVEAPAGTRADAAAAATVVCDTAATALFEAAAAVAASRAVVGIGAGGPAASAACAPSTITSARHPGQV